MKTMMEVEVDLSQDEIDEFNRVCSESGACPAQKLGDLVHAFILAFGVKHRFLKVRRKPGDFWP